ncbi:MAG TPA: glycosyltransferase family 2 protein [Coriobacteriia bacterium]
MTDRPCASDVCVVMPVFNEETTVAGVLDAVRVYFDGGVVVVDDGSTDATAGIVSGRSDVTLLRHDANRGYGASLASGFARALEVGAGVVVTMDCDGQHEPRHIPEFCAEMASRGADVVSGSRYLPGSAVVGRAPADRQDVNRRIAAIVNGLTGWSLTDAFCGFKAYRAEALRRAPVDEPEYAVPMQFWARAWRAGLTVCEMPVERIYSDSDRSFGADLDDPERRFAYYVRVWERTLAEDRAAVAGAEVPAVTARGGVDRG